MTKDCTILVFLPSNLLVLSCHVSSSGIGSRTSTVSTSDHRSDNPSFANPTAHSLQPPRLVQRGHLVSSHLSHPSSTPRRADPLVSGHTRGASPQPRVQCEPDISGTHRRHLLGRLLRRVGAASTAPPPSVGSGSARRLSTGLGPQSFLARVPCSLSLFHLCPPKKSWSAF